MGCAAVWEGGRRVCHGGGEVGEGCGWVGCFTASSSWRSARLAKKNKLGARYGYCYHVSLLAKGVVKVALGPSVLLLARAKPL